MTIKELIEKLEEYDDEDEVRIADEIFFIRDEEGWVEEIYIEGGEDINYVARSTEDGKVYISKE